MASGIGPSNMSQLLSFLDIPQCQSLHGSFFRNIELTVGSSLRKIVIDSIQDAIDEEVRLTLDYEKNSNNINKVAFGLAYQYHSTWA